VTIGSGTMKRIASNDPGQMQAVRAITIGADDVTGDVKFQIDKYRLQLPRVIGLPKYSLGKMARTISGVHFTPVAVQKEGTFLYLVLISDRGKRGMRTESDELAAYVEMTKMEAGDEKKAKMSDFFRNATEYITKNPHDMDARIKKAAPKQKKTFKEKVFGKKKGDGTSS
jgi:hypothetical protein